MFTSEAALQAGWMPTYRFKMDACRPVDYELPNWFTATHPRSIFRHNLKLERLTSQKRATVLNDKLTLRPPNAPAQTRRIADAEELAKVLENVFDPIGPVSPAELFERIPKGLDSAFLPPRA